MTVFELKNSNLSQLTRLSDTYFLIQEQIALSAVSYTLQKGCVLDFRGGSFVSSGLTKHKLVLNGAKVYAPSYCIFGKGISVSGFTNDVVKSEWFRTDSNEANAINRAIEAAQGCPVELECRDYELSESIVFNTLSSGATQTLISPGTLIPKNSFPAIRINTSKVNLKVNRIEGSVLSGVPVDGKAVQIILGIGVEISNTAQHCVLDVNEMFSLEKGFSVSPVATLQPDGGTYAGVQYCKFYFQSIRANTCFYVSLPFGTWFTESFIFGGRMAGHNGIFFESLPSGSRGNCDTLLIENIGLEDLDEKPIQLCGITQSVLSDLRMAEALPGITGEEWSAEPKWIYLEDVSYLRIGIKTYLRPGRIEYAGRCSDITFEGFAVENEDWALNVFDRLHISQIQRGSKSENVMTATSSVQPFNMCKSIEATSPVSNPSVVYLEELFPLVKNSYGTSPSRPVEFNVLPRTLNVTVGSGKAMILDVSYLIEYAPCALVDVLADISFGGQLWFRKRSERSTNVIKSADGNVITEGDTTKIMFNESALYRLTFDEDWNLFITRVVF